MNKDQVNLSIPEDFALGVVANLTAELITRVVSSDNEVLMNIQRNQVVLDKKLNKIIKLLE